jgi:hypothetical protein
MLPLYFVGNEFRDEKYVNVAVVANFFFFLSDGEVEIPFYYHLSSPNSHLKNCMVHSE